MRHKRELNRLSRAQDPKMRHGRELKQLSIAPRDRGDFVEVMAGRAESTSPCELYSGVSLRCGFREEGACHTSLHRHKTLHRLPQATGGAPTIRRYLNLAWERGHRTAIRLRVHTLSDEDMIPWT
jgi:hypothetical protein